MRKKEQPKTPPMTAKDLRDFVISSPSFEEASLVFDEMKTWYFANCHLITIGIDYAFRNELGRLEKYLKGVK